MDILDDMGVSKLSAKVFSKVNYSFNAFLGFTVIHQCVLLKMLTEFSGRFCEAFKLHYPRGRSLGKGQMT